MAADAGRDDLYRAQIARLFQRSPFYREKLGAAGFVSPADVGGLVDIARLPFTEKDELRASQAAHAPLGAHAAIDASQAARIYSTSGTSGTPLYISLECVERIIVGGEPGGGEAGFRRKLESAWGAKVFEIMGIGDIAASLWGECAAQAGMHFSAEEWIHVELIEPQSGRPVELADGTTGELVYTHLAREAAPLLRFRSRDHARVWTSLCHCGRTSLRARCIGRTDDMLIVRGVNVFPSAVREVVARFQPKVTGAILIRPQRKGVKQDPPLPVLVEGDASVGEAIGREIRATLLFTPEVRMVAPQSLPRSDYKVKLLDYSEAK